MVVQYSQFWRWRLAVRNHFAIDNRCASDAQWRREEFGYLSACFLGYGAISAAAAVIEYLACLLIRPLPLPIHPQYTLRCGVQSTTTMTVYHPNPPHMLVDNQQYGLGHFNEASLANFNG